MLLCNLWSLLRRVCKLLNNCDQFRNMICCKEAFFIYFCLTVWLAKHCWHGRLQIQYAYISCLELLKCTSLAVECLPRWQWCVQVIAKCQMSKSRRVRACVRTRLDFARTHAQTYCSSLNFYVSDYNRSHQTHRGSGRVDPTLNWNKNWEGHLFFGWWPHSWWRHRTHCCPPGSGKTLWSCTSCPWWGPRRWRLAGGSSPARWTTPSGWVGGWGGGYIHNALQQLPFQPDFV